MSRQAQNVLMAAVASLAVLAAMAAVALNLRGSEEAATTAGIDPLGQSAEVAPSVSADSLPTTSLMPPQALAVQPEEATTITAMVDTSTTLATTTTTVATTTVAPTVTTIATTTTAGNETTEAEQTSTTVAGEEISSTTSADGSTTTSSTMDPTTTTAAEGNTTSTEESTTTVATTVTTDPPDSGSMNSVELEIARLTNELRTNPNGPLRREGPAIDCGERILVDLDSGQYQSIGALSVNETASLQVARPWSAQMSPQNFEHRARAGITALQGVGINVRSAGENIAYHNFPNKAMNHFVGWRESDGHFCNMMDPNFTHIGVGEVTKSDGISYATQNFYSTR